MIGFTKAVYRLHDNWQLTPVAASFRAVLSILLHLHFILVTFVRFSYCCHPLGLCLKSVRHSCPENVVFYSKYMHALQHRMQGEAGQTVHTLTLLWYAVSECNYNSYTLTDNVTIIMQVCACRKPRILPTPHTYLSEGWIDLDWVGFG